MFLYINSGVFWQEPLQIKAALGNPQSRSIWILYSIRNESTILSNWVILFISFFCYDLHETERMTHSNSVNFFIFGFSDCW